jgi:DNA-binding NarL/FixJ family response regulator
VFTFDHLRCYIVPLTDTVFQPIAVLVADSSQMQSQLLTGALRRRPDFKVTACEMDAESILSWIPRACVDVILLNPSLHDEGCFGVLRRIHLTHPQIPIILLGECYERDIVINAFPSGVRGIFCYAEESVRSLCKCIHNVRDGQVWASSEQINFLLDLVCQVPSLRVINDCGRSLLTPREEQVVALVAEGLSNRDVSRELSLSEHTVKKYLFRIFDKLGVSNRVELVLYAVHHGDARAAEWVPGISA